jgi:hypothetical protein
MIITNRGNENRKGTYYLKKQRCSNCDTEVIISSSDLWEHYGYAYFLCPCCGEKVYAVKRFLPEQTEAECIKVDVKQLLNREKEIKKDLGLIGVGIAILFSTALIILALAI